MESNVVFPPGSGAGLLELSIALIAIGWGAGVLLALLIARRRQRPSHLPIASSG